jgi:hypothetical protein
MKPIPSRSAHPESEKPHPEVMWARIHANQQRNPRLMFREGVRPDTLEPAVCPSCGAHENPIFWTVTLRLGKTCLLLCPVCERGRTLFRAPADRDSNRRRMRWAVRALVLSVAAAGLIAGRDSAALQVVTDEVAELFATFRGAPGRPAFFAEAASQSNPADARVFVASGDRRRDVDRYAHSIAQTHGQAEARLLTAVRYDPSLGQTRATVDPASQVWPRALHRLRGWRTLE